jgi:hypothetical protein
MLFIATMEHSPDNCWAREENSEIAWEYISGIGERAEEHDVTLHGSYAAPNEHTIFFIMGAESFADVSEFLGEPFLQDHTGDIVPVLTFGEVEETVLGD